MSVTSASLTIVSLRAGRSSEGLPAALARVCDALLDFLVLALAAWTVVYHLSLALGIGTFWAGLLGAAALVPCGLVAVRDEAAPGALEPPRRPWSDRLGALVGLNAIAGLTAAALFAFTDVSWRGIWVVWAVAAGAAVLVTVTGPSHAGRAAPAPAEPRGPGPLSTAIALGWAVALAGIAAVLVRGSEDDTYYVHLSTWIAAHGTFPLRDTIFSDEVFPAIIYPPVSSFEAAVGTIARATDIAVPNLVYYVVAPLVGALGVLAVWRLYRAWSVPLVGAALSVAMVFLLLDGEEHWAPGNTIVARSWHGKVALVTVLVPVLFVLLQRYMERPTRRGLALVAAAGVAAVGLSSTGIFLVPVVSLGVLAPLARAAPRRAAVAFGAAVSYPVAAGLVSALAGARTAETNPYPLPGRLLQFVFGGGFVALAAVAAVLLAPVLVPRLAAARMAAGTVLLVTILFAPPVTRLVYDVTGLGRVLWRLTWAVPTAALVGVLAVGLSARIRSPILRLLPAVALCAALVAWGTPAWSLGQIRLADRPAWKRPDGTIVTARWILSKSEPGDVVLAPTKTSQTIAVMSGDVYTVAPRPFYALALEGAGAHPKERVVLGAFADGGLEQVIPRRRVRPTADQVAEGLEAVGVDLACVADSPRTRQVLLGAGYELDGAERGLVCARPGP